MNINDNERVVRGITSLCGIILVVIASVIGFGSVAPWLLASAGIGLIYQSAV